MVKRGREKLHGTSHQCSLASVMRCVRICTPFLLRIRDLDDDGLDSATNKSHCMNSLLVTLKKRNRKGKKPNVERLCTPWRYEWFVADTSDQGLAYLFPLEGSISTSRYAKLPAIQSTAAQSRDYRHKSPLSRQDAFPPIRRDSLSHLYLDILYPKLQHSTSAIVVLMIHPQHG